MGNYDRERFRPILRKRKDHTQIAGFKDVHTGVFEEVMEIHSSFELDHFMEKYDISTITKEE